MGVLTQRCVKSPKNGELWSTFTGSSGKLRIVFGHFFLSAVSFQLVFYPIASMTAVATGFSTVCYPFCALAFFES